MQSITEIIGKLSCDFNACDNENYYEGILNYNEYEVGRISGSDLTQIRTQFQIIAQLISGGAMVRHGIIMLNYHNKVFSGDVLLVNGEVLGAWHTDDLEWSYFIANDEDKVVCSAPSPWMLHNLIADWFEKAQD